jgi:hypothetical protein
MARSLRIRFVLMAVLFVALLAITVTLSSFYKATARVKTLVIPPDVLACDTDEDCGVSNQIDCCPCEASGGQGAVNKRMRLQLKTFLEGACHERVPCVDVSSCRDDLTAVCRDTVCVVTPRRI